MTNDYRVKITIRNERILKLIEDIACTGWDDINDWSFSLVNTPGDTICSAMIDYLFVINIIFFLKN